MTTPLCTAILSDAAEWGSDGSGTLFRPSRVRRPEEDEAPRAWFDEAKQAWTARGVSREADHDFIADWGINAFQTAAGETIWVATLRAGYSFKGIPLFRQQFVGAAFSRNEVVQQLMNVGFIDSDDYEARRHSWKPIQEKPPCLGG